MNNSQTSSSTKLSDDQESGPHERTEPELEIEWIHGEPDPIDDDIVDENVTDTASVEAKLRRKRERRWKQSRTAKLKENVTVISAVLAGVCVSIVKFTASVLTGSAAMFSEGIHSMVDAINDSLLLVGSQVAKRPPDVEHPFGYGQLSFFYSFIVALVIFFVGGGFAILQGVSGIADGGHAIENPIIDYIVLGIGIVLEGISLSIAFKTVNAARGEKDMFSYIRDAKDPTNITVLLEDSAAVLGMVIAFIGIFLSEALNAPIIDSVASVLIGCVMAIVALILLRETRGLLIGEGFSKEEIEEVVFLVEEDPAVIKCGRVLSLYVGPDDLLVNLDVTFDDEIDEGDVLQAVDRIEASIVDAFPQTSRIFVEAESLNQVYRQRRDRKNAFEAAEEE